MENKTAMAGVLTTFLLIIFMVALIAAGCSGEPLTPREEGTLGGAAIGAGGGALVGAAVGHPGAGAAIGGAAGGITGYAIGNHIQNEQDERNYRRGDD